MDQSANHLLMRGSQPGPADRMRDLLARTVQDHVTDQRSHASALEEIRKHLEGLEWLVKEVREHELTDLAGQLPISRQAITKHLELLAAAGLVLAEPGERRRIRYRVNAAPMAMAQSYLAALARDWDSKLTRLQRTLDTSAPEPEAAAPEPRTPG